MQNQTPSAILPHPIKALILDDEIEACRNLETLLKRDWNHNIEIIGIAQSTEDAEKIIKTIQPQVLFIDIEMPEENAFHFLDRIDRSHFEIIFVTAYDEYALRALKLNAIDYILKPISLDELENAIKKLEEKLVLRQMTQALLPQYNLSNFADIINKKKPNESLVLRSKNEIVVLDFKDIFYIEAIGSYSNFHYKKGNEIGQILMSHPLLEYEEILPSSMFFRIHKSYLINSHQVKKVIKEDQLHVELNQNIQLPLSRRRYIGFMDFLKHKN